jgi:hypothetical protein
MVNTLIVAGSRRRRRGVLYTETWERKGREKRGMVPNGRGEKTRVGRFERVTAP